MSIISKFIFTSILFNFRMEMMGHNVTFSFQFGHLRDTVTASVSSLNLKSFKDMACSFINSKVRFHRIHAKLCRKMNPDVFFLYIYTDSKPWSCSLA